MGDTSALVITGASGWLGRSLVDFYCQHVDQGRLERLICLVHHPDDVPALRRDLTVDATGLIDIRAVDICDGDAVTEVLGDVPEGFDLLHCAGLIHPRRIEELVRVNVHGTRHILAAADRSRRMVHVSSNSPFGTNPDPLDHFREFEPYNPYLAYGRTKMEAELAVLEAVDRGTDAVIVRPPWFYGPFQPERQTTFFSLVRRGRFPVFGAGDQRRSMVYLDNLVDGIERARQWRGESGKAWWIADARAYTVAEIVETVGRALRDEGLWVAPPAVRLPSFIGELAERADRIVQSTGRYIQAAHVLGEMNKTISCDISAARRDLGYEPQIDLADGMRRSVRWCLGRGMQL